MRPLSPEQTAFLSAALRHTRDARHLCAPGDHRSIEQAWHLAGFGPECARKALLPDDAPYYKELGHEVGPDAEACLRWLLTLDPSIGRYEPLGWSAQGAPLARWTPESRYSATGELKDRSGRILDVMVVQLVEQADELVDGLVERLWLDGRIKDLP